MKNRTRQRTLRAPIEITKKLTGKRGKRNEVGRVNIEEQQNRIEQ